jgi:hypothetical protein
VLILMSVHLVQLSVAPGMRRSLQTVDDWRERPERRARCLGGWGSAVALDHGENRCSGDHESDDHARECGGGDGGGGPYSGDAENGEDGWRAADGAGGGSCAVEVVVA